MKENNFSNLMQENVANYKKSYSSLNLSHNDFGLQRGDKYIYDDEQAKNNISSQINFVRILIIFS
jgi:hypothetical protein